MKFRVCTRSKETTSFKGMFWIGCNGGYLNKKGKILGYADPNCVKIENLTKDRDSSWYNGERTAVASIVRYCKKNNIGRFTIEFDYNFGE